MANTDIIILIDGKTLTSPNPTSGAALYVLGKVPAGYDLFEEIPGAGDDKLIPNDGTQILLKGKPIFYSAKQSLNPGDGR